MGQEKQNNNGVDLSKSFDNSGKKFQEEKRSSEYVFYPGTPKIIQWVVKYSGGLIKDEKQAAYVLFGIITLAIIVSLFLFFGGGREQNTPPVEQYIDKQQFLPK
ncbi:MAG: hypothetical protein WAP51_01755 [Candidatus Sungiibacteriota bacterium]